jgi:succinyl-diaminopimelate desuccinylase
MEVLELTKSLISCPSVTPKNEGVLDLLDKELSEIGFKCHRYLFSDHNTPDVDNLFAKFGNGSPHLCFGGHTDVVPVGDLDSWSYNPFKPTEEDGRIYGRGASDMKSAIGAFVCAARNYIKSSDFSGSISLLITNDEEGPAINGTKKVLQKLYEDGEKIDSCIVGEPTCPNKLGEMIKIGRRGSLTSKITIKGKQGHVAYPQWTLNPINPLTKILSNICNINLDSGTNDFPPSNIEVVNISSSDGASNVVPQIATGQLNVRYNINHNEESLTKIFDEVVKEEIGDSEYDFKIEHNNSAEPFLTEKGGFINIIKESVDEVAGLDAALTTTGGTSDARFFKDYCEVAEFGLIGETAHQVDENVKIADIENLEKIYYSILKKYFHKK